MQYLLAKARNRTTGQTVKAQDLTGSRFTLNQSAFAQQAADRLAKTMSATTDEQWTGYVERYTPSVRRNQD